MSETDPIDTNFDYDLSGWPDEDKAAFVATMRELAETEGKLDAERAAKASPAAMLADAREKLEARRAELAAAEMERKDKAALEAAEKAHGKDRVAIVETRSGAVIIRTETPREADEYGGRVSAPGLSDPDRERIARDFLSGLVVYPDKPAFAELVKQYPSLWARLTKASNDLASGARQERSKK